MTFSLIALLLIALPAHVYAQTACIRAFQLDTIGYFQGFLLREDADVPATWCPYWERACDYYNDNCATLTCDYTDLATGCSVVVDPDAVPAGALVPAAPPTPSPPPPPISTLSPPPLSGPTTPNNTSTPGFSGAVAPRPTYDYGSSGVPTGDIFATYPVGGVGSALPAVAAISSFPTHTPLPGESEASSYAILGITVLLVVGGIVGAVVAMKYTHSASEKGFDKPETRAAPGPAKGGVASSAIDPVLLLLHFQFISTTGFLSLSYPHNYLGFTYHFSFANFISPVFTTISSELAGTCWMTSSQVRADVSETATGFQAVARRYGLQPGTLAGVVNLGVILGFGLAQCIVLIVTLFSVIFKRSSNEGLRRMGERWPSMASNLSLRLCLWVWGTVATFAFYQFQIPCPSTIPLVLSIVEFCVILLALLTVSTLITRAASKYGIAKLYSTEEEESVYARRWGSLYSSYKPNYFKYFMADYLWVMSRSAIIAFAQYRGLIQVSALGGLEFAILLLLLIQRPYDTGAANTVYIGFAVVRMLSTGLLATFIPGVASSERQKETAAIVIIAITMTYAGAVALILIFKLVAGIIDMRKKRQGTSEQVSATTQTADSQEEEK
ncbi:hypothetical protein FA15DRAFT_707425 [Coprinopsis marcescibilis]|uniref:TRP C-terminal domain-containing protein n=1 Tax=Coprinopsis marcescibilis TaxID=230819 RepID=A0A5C3KZ73_COPMA|nr:hypothetical protein FA15DRAFT_707425 [Coprinopsis marcescibilis]